MYRSSFPAMTIEKLESQFKGAEDRRAKELSDLREELRLEMQSNGAKLIEEVKILMSGMRVQPSAVLQHGTPSSSGLLGAAPGSQDDSSSSAHHYTKLEFPRFNGVNLGEWVYKAEQFFEVDQTSDHSKVRIAAIHLDDRAFHWYKSFVKTLSSPSSVSWSDFIHAASARFGEQLFSDPIAEMKKLKQVHSVQDYLEAFDIVLSQTDLTETQAISHFLGGLKEEIELSVRLFNPTTLQSAYAMAKVQEVLWSKKNSKDFSLRNQQPSRVFGSKPWFPSTAKVETKQSKSLSSREMDERRQKGLCFWCEEKYVPGHRCKKMQLYMLTIDPDEDDLEDPVRIGKDDELDMEGEEEAPKYIATIKVPARTLRRCVEEEAYEKAEEEAQKDDGEMEVGSWACKRCDQP